MASSASTLVEITQNSSTSNVSNVSTLAVSSPIDDNVVVISSISISASASVSKPAFISLPVFPTVSAPVTSPVYPMITTAAETVYSCNNTSLAHHPSFALLQTLTMLPCPSIRVHGCSYLMGGASGPMGIENQDDYSVTRFVRKGNKYVITVLCDGHGYDGKTFSSQTTRRLPLKVIDKFDAILTNPLVLTPLFNEFNEELRRDYGSHRGGTTITLTIVCDGRIIVANLGDCEAVAQFHCLSDSIILTRDGVSQSCSSPIIYLTRSHGPHDASELARIRSLGCTIRHTGRPVDADQTPGMYVQCPRSGAQLNLTRAFADFPASFMSPIPTITDVTFPPTTRVTTIICSDGAGDCFTHNRPVEGFLAMTNLFTLSPAEICNTCQSEAGRLFGPTHADNTTVLVVESGGPHSRPSPPHPALPLPLALRSALVSQPPPPLPTSEHTRPVKRVRFSGVPDTPPPPPPPPAVYMPSPLLLLCEAVQRATAVPQAGPPPPLLPLGGSGQQVAGHTFMTE